MKVDAPRKRGVQARRRQDPEGPSARSRLVRGRGRGSPRGDGGRERPTPGTVRENLEEEKPTRAAASGQA